MRKRPLVWTVVGIVLLILYVAISGSVATTASPDALSAAHGAGYATGRVVAEIIIVTVPLGLVALLVWGIVALVRRRDHR